SDAGFVEVDQVAPPDAAHAVGPALRVAAVRMVVREHETRELTGGPRGRVVRLDAYVVQELAPHPVDLALRERRMGGTVDEGPALMHEVRSGDVPDALAADLLDLREQPVSEVPGRDAFSRAEQHPLERDAVLLVPRPRADLLLRPLDLRPTRRGVTLLIRPP